MRPSERRKEGKRAWTLFIVLCVGSIILVLGSTMLAGKLVEPRFHEDTEEQEEEAGDVKSTTPLIGVFASEQIKQAAHVSADTLKTERRVELSGAVVFLKGALVLDHAVVAGDRTTGDHLLLVTFEPEQSSVAEEHRGQLVIRVLNRSGGTWNPMPRELFQRTYANINDPGGEFPSKDNVSIQDAGSGVLAVRIPDAAPCLPSTKSDLGLTRAVYVVLDPAPQVLLSHIAAGRRGNLPGQTAEIGLSWASRSGVSGAGLMRVRTFTEDTLTNEYELAFSNQDKSFSLAESPSLAFAKQEREAIAAYLEGKDDAEERLLWIENGLQLILPLQGPLDYCLGFPHRVFVATQVDPRKWADALQDRIFSLRLPRADLMARRGQGRRAIELLNLDDPALVLTSSAAGRRLLAQLRGPRVAESQYQPFLSKFERRPAFATHATRPYLPMRFTEQFDLVLPVFDARSLSLGLGKWTLGSTTTGLGAALSGLLLPPWPQNPVAAALWSSTIHGADKLLVWESPSFLANRLAMATRKSANERANRIAALTQRYLGPKFVQLATKTGALSPARWEDLQFYAPLMSAVDLSPSSSKLIIDYGVTCQSAFVQLCIGYPEQCRDIGPSEDPFRPSSRIVTVSSFDFPDWAPAPCFDRETPTRLQEAVHFHGWLSDSELVFEHRDALYLVTIDLAGEATCQPLADDAQSPLVETDRQGHWRISLDANAIWLIDQQTQREWLLEWWSSLPLGPPRQEWSALISADGAHFGLWLENEGLWTADLSRLPE